MDIRNILNIIPKEESKNSNTFDGTLESIARVAGVDYKPKVVTFEGYTDDEVRELCHSKDHDCATTVNHPIYGKGKPVYESHAIPDDKGNVEWYDVQFKHGVERKVPAADMEIVTLEEHGAAKPKKKKAKEDAKSKKDSKSKEVKESEVEKTVNEELSEKDKDTEFASWLKKTHNKDVESLKGDEYVKVSKEFQSSKKKEESFKAKFDDMVAEAGKPDFLDLDKDGDKKEPMKKAAKDAKGGKKSGKKEMSDKQKKFFGKKKESVEEAAEVITAEKMPKKKDILMMCSKGMKVNEICKKYPNCDQKKLKEMCEACMSEVKAKKKNESVNEAKDGKMPSKAHVKKMCKDGMTKAEMCKMHPDCDQPKLKAMIDDCKKEMKESVNESVEVIKDPSNMSFVEMLKLVKESGGQQQIDPVDETLWNWAQRVATSKVEESEKAEIFAGMIYERNGGRFEMYDVMDEDGLTEAKKKTEEKKNCGCGQDPCITYGKKDKQK